MKLTCTICGNKFEGRVDAKTCSDTCRKNASRVTDNPKNVTDNELSVTKPILSVTDSVTATPDGVSENAGLNKWDLNLNPEKDPLKRITEIPSDTVDMDYYHSQTYKNLVEELEVKSITQLTKEKYFIPAWKISGNKKKPDVKDSLK